MKYKLISLIILIIGLQYISSGKSTPDSDNGYEIKVKIKGYKENIAYLCYALGGQTYILDSAEVVEEKMCFKGQELLHSGIYRIALLPNKNYFEILIDNYDQQFSIETSLSDLVEKMKIEGSAENNIFLDFLHFSLAKSANKSKYQKILNESEKSSNDYKNAELKLKLINDELSEYINSVIQNNPESYTALLLNLNKEPVIPNSIKEISDEKEKKNEEFYYYKNNYLSNINLADNRVVYTPFFEQKILFYIERLSVQNHDSLITSVNYIINKTKGNKETYKYSCMFLFNYFAKSKFVCFDAVYVYIADNYYFNENAPFGGAYWLQEYDRKNIEAKTNDLRPMLCNKVFPTLFYLETIEGLEHTKAYLLDNLSEYTILYFWNENGNSSVNTYAKELSSYYSTFKKNNIGVIGIYIKSTSEEERKDPTRYEKAKEMMILQGAEWKTFGSFKESPHNLNPSFPIHNPYLVLLDKNMKIILKQVDPEQIMNYLKGIDKIK